jgi:hypothetical protein
MSAVNAPFGLKPLFHPSGNIVPVQATIESEYDSNIFQYSPVKYGSTTSQGYVIMAPTDETLVGSFQGCQYTDVNGRRNFSNKWPANTVATEIVCWITTDPQIVYEIQGTGSIDFSAVGMQGNYSTNNSAAGNIYTGLSSVTLGTPSASVDGQLRVIGLSQAVNNEWGDAFTVVQVQIAEHQFVEPIGPF